MAVDDIRAAKLEAALEKLKSGTNIQNRQLKTLLGAETYARFLDDCQQQLDLREALANLPEPIVEYAKRLKVATFTYNKADAASCKGKHAAARKLFADADTLFERLNEFLSEKIAGDGELEIFLDRPIMLTCEEAASSGPENFPCVVTSKSLRNIGGGILMTWRSKRQVKIDIIEQALEVEELGDMQISRVLENAKQRFKRAND